jgi:uncharacterized protein (DUF486 family)
MNIESAKDSKHPNGRYFVIPVVKIGGDVVTCAAGHRGRDHTEPAGHMTRSSLNLLGSIRKRPSIQADPEPSAPDPETLKPNRMKIVLVPMMLALAGMLMACAWIAHLKFKSSWSFGTALVMSWLFVLPEYIFNVFSARWGIGTYSGAQMAAMHLAFGVIAVAIVSRFFLGEPLSTSQLCGFGLMIVAIGLIVFKP